jgi:hypothetical protein
MNTNEEVLFNRPGSADDVLSVGHRIYKKDGKYVVEFYGVEGGGDLEEFKTIKQALKELKKQFKMDIDEYFEYYIEDNDKIREEMIKVIL